MNIIAGTCVFLLSLFFSKLVSDKYAKRANFYREMYQFNKILQAEVLFSKATIKVIIDNLNDKTDFAFMLKEYFNNKIVKTDFYYLDMNERRFIENYLFSLGVGDEETQLKTIQSMGEQIIEKQKNSEIETKKYSAISVKLGFLTGITGLIIFL